MDSAKRGQVTSFIIVGIVILFILAFTIYFLSTIKSTPPIIEVIPDKTNYRACLEQALDLSIQEIAERGGSLTTPPLGGPIYLDASSIATEVRFGIRSGAPIQPGSYSEGMSQFGTVGLQPLCLLRGPNRPNAGRDFQNDCLAGTYQLMQPDTEILQHAIAAKTSASAQLCGVNSTVIVTLGADDVTAVAGNLSVKNNARFKRLYNAAFALAIADTKDLYFDKQAVVSLPGCQEPKSGNECLLPGMVLSSRADQKGATVVEITDTTRKTPGPLTFRFAVENRAPVITDFTRNTAQAPFTVASEESRELFVDAADPDELDKLTFGCQGPLWARCSAGPAQKGMRVIVKLEGCTLGEAEESTVTVTISDGKTSSGIQFPVRLEPLSQDRDACTKGTGISPETIHPLLRAIGTTSYLLDASISMGEKATDELTKWEVVTSYPFGSSTIFIFNDNVNPLPQPVAAASLAGVPLDYGTPLYDSAWLLLEKDGHFENLTIITDGADSTSSKTVPEVVSKARADNTKLNVIVIGQISLEHQLDMMNLAVQTGGTFYIRT